MRNIDQNKNIGPHVRILSKRKPAHNVIRNDKDSTGIMIFRLDKQIASLAACHHGLHYCQIICLCMCFDQAKKTCVKKVEKRSKY